MSEETANDEGGLTLVQSKSTLRTVLGRVEAKGAHVEKGRPAANNTRWVFDVETEGGEPIAVQLLEYRSGRPLRPEMMSPNLTPMDENAASASIWGEDKGTHFVLHAKSLGGHKRFKVRVSIDIMHSAHR